ncbi:germin-like protein 1 [Tripterygium wilfordii]|uniref:Germin-like protein n=1 Tax=Tripterygium wilfordii TaxID=458696 RepID=A0A7J7DQ75_TRIWF|nr:germin-like protein 9-3 [Tripterygium wilfordii]XP_038699204.1 germin-like protein 9-3 [Tripterygium wilfordii]XP_038699205.1 germin-like protein 9-3 [Tripterygium wilfordii]KAF5748442.1 germin-like protein 1 [Tripterygium wilfordii]KAF5748443.1 germin-like protein 1 [Tripterygium wilfordii]KAF5748444.1 germin-like protein 1 [Tripterygium wilfordii]
MASTTSTNKFFFFLLLASFAIAQVAKAGDADITSDFLAPAGAIVDGNFFTYTGMRSIVNAKPPANFTVTKVSMAEFPALNGQSVSYAILQFPASTVNPPHIHPRSAELLFLTRGSLQVGFVDTTNKLYTQTLLAGDMFVFPKGLVHFQYNIDPENIALAISAFGSASAGTQSLPATLFATNIDENILAKSFKTDVATIQALKAGLAPKA